VMNGQVYLDYAATTPVAEEVAAAINGCLGASGSFANPSSEHGPGRIAARLVDEARAEVAGLIGSSPEELVWTSGATESDNLAILGVARTRRSDRAHVVTAVTEHPAVLDSCRQLEREGHRVSWLVPDRTGLIDPAQVGAAIGRETALVSIMHVNNETGVVQDIGAIGSVCRETGALFHVDAAQSAGRAPIDVREQSVDLLSLSAHKCYGPKGIGALFIDRARAGRLQPLMFGGGQQRGMRPGTLPVHQIVGMGCALALAAVRLEHDARDAAALRGRLWRQISGIPGILLNGHPDRQSGHILNVSVPGVEGESLMAELGKKLAVSSGSACASGSPDASAVLRSMGRPDQLARSSVRFSFGRQTTGADTDLAARQLIAAVDRLRALATERPLLPAPGRAVMRGEAGRAETGTRIVLQIETETDQITRAVFSVFGCPVTEAACRRLGARLEGAPVVTLGEFDPRALLEELGAPEDRLGRLLVIEDALRNCLVDWENKRLCVETGGSWQSH